MIRLLLALFCAFSLSEMSFAQGGCDCASLRQSCGAERADSIRHIVRNRPSCSLEAIESCGMKYDLKLKSKLSIANNQETDLFIATIANEADAIMDIYRGHVTPREYTELAAMAFAIAGNESGFFHGQKYLLKRHAPTWAIETVKCRWYGKCDTDHSYGPTQLKTIPKAIAKKYGMTLDSLYSNPKHAAVATMAFLIEMKEYIFNLKNSYSSLSGLDQTTYIDYLAYFYQGKGRRPLMMEMPNGADPSRNGYLYSLRNYQDTLLVSEHQCPVLSTELNPPAAIDGALSEPQIQR